MSRLDLILGSVEVGSQGVMGAAVGLVSKPVSNSRH